MNEPVTFNKPFPPWPHYSDSEIAAVTDVLRSGRVNQWTGNEIAAFEDEYARAIGTNRAIAVANGTLALELALLAYDIGPGDDVVVPSRTFIATASAAIARGARPVVADVDRDSGNVTPATVAAALTPNTKAVIVVHFAGWPCDMHGLRALADEKGFVLIEDCAQAHGAEFRGKPVGSFGEVGSFSFCQDKIITTGGEGGLIAMSDEAAWRKAWAFKDHGKSRAKALEQDHPPGFRWLHDDFGSNWRLTEMQAALGRKQLQLLPGWHEARKRNAEALIKRLARHAVMRVPVPASDVEHAYYKLYAYLEPEKLRPGWDRDKVMAEVARRGVPCISGSCSEIYLEKAFKDRGLGPRDRLPVAQELGATSLAFVVHPTLGPEDLDLAADVIDGVLAEAAL